MDHDQRKNLRNKSIDVILGLIKSLHKFVKSLGKVTLNSESEFIVKMNEKDN